MCVCMHARVYMCVFLCACVYVHVLCKYFVYIRTYIFPKSPALDIPKALQV